jgi:hypothetical protein
MYDLVDIGRGSISDFFNQLHTLFACEVHAVRTLGEHAQPEQRQQYVNSIETMGDGLLHTIERLDQFLATNTAFLLGPWLRDARLAATSPAEADLFEFSARNQLMMWGPSPEVGPNPDYANKHWQGLVGTYYLQRWKIYIDAIVAGVRQVPTDPELLPPTALLDAFAQNFTRQTDHAHYPVTGTGGTMTLKLSHELLNEFNGANGSALLGYTKHPGVDNSRAQITLNLGQNFTGDLDRLATLCNIHPRCVAFNSNGWLKSDATITDRHARGDYYTKRQN